MTGGRKSWQSMAGFVTVAVVGVATFALAWRTFPNRISAPFGLAPSGTLSGISFGSGLTAGDDLSSLLLDTKDTDGDGIPDAQELKVYGTSPFLEDSDSDGINDSQEILSGTDPNCPQGTDCRIYRLPSVREVESQELTRKLYETTVTSKVDELGIPGVTDAATIRANLKASGISDEVLAQFNDEELVRLFNQATASPGVANSNNSATLNDIETPAPAAIRELLLSAGAKPEVIDSFSDEELVRLYRETLSDLNTPQ